MWNRRWTLFVIGTSGTEIEHWTAHNREECRRELRSLKAQCGGKLPSGVKTTIRKTFDIDEVPDVRA